MTKTPSIGTRVKNPKRIEAGTKFVEYNKKKKASLKKADVAPAANPSSTNPTVEENQGEGIIYKGLGLVVIGVFTHISFTKDSRQPPRPIERAQAPSQETKM